MSKPDVNEAAQYFESIFAVTHDGIVFVDHEGVILRVNPAFTKILGYEEHEILGKPFYILEYKDEVMQKNMSQQPLINFHKTERSNLEMTLFDKQGCNVSVRFRSAFIKDKHDHNAQIIGMIERMPEKTDTDNAGDSLAEKMWEAQQNFENVLNNSADAIAVCDVDGNIMLANKSFSKMLDYTQEEMIGKHIVEFTAYLEGTYPTTTGEEITIDEESIANNASRPAEVYEKGYISNWEFYMVRKDKVHIPVEATLSLLQDKDGDRRGSVIIGRDITERKKAEEERKQLLEELKDKNKELEQVFYVASHDLRSPLVNVQGFSRELEQTFKDVQSILSQSKEISSQTKETLAPALDEDIPEALQYILTSISKMDSLLSGLLRLSRLGRAALTIKNLDMNKLVLDITKSFEYQVKETGITLKIDELPSCLGDETQINQVFSNLVDNALKYLNPSQTGAITISGRRENGHAVYYVEDNGIGIAPEHQDRIYEIFHRLNPSATEGEGLGLTIARKILDRHAGRLWVKSQLGKGSKFIVSLPTN